MIYLKTRVFNCLPINVIWFAAKPQLWQCLTSYYKQSTYAGPVKGYYRVPFFTKLIDITKPIPVIESELENKTAYEIRRAIKDGVTVEVENDVKHFIGFYNAFAQTKHLKKIKSKLNNYNGQLIITKAVFEHNDVVMHAYVCDAALKRVRLLYSASLFRNESNTQFKATIGRANRLLHFNDMCFFKEQGYHTYDLGGYAMGTADEALARINQFKDGFGGILVEESDFLPLPALVLSYINKIYKA